MSNRNNRDERNLSSATREVTDSSKLHSSDISNLKSIWGEDPAGRPYNVTSTESSVPMVMRIGRGYDVFGEYASVKSLKEPVLDIDRLIEDQRVERVRHDDVKSTTVDSRTIRDYSRDLSDRAKADSSVYGFTRTVESNFDKSRTQDTKNYFSTHSHVVRKYSVYVKPSTSYSSYLTPEAREMLHGEDFSPERIFSTFGHYVLVDTVTGGRIDYSVTASTSASTSFENFQAATRADFDVAMFGSQADQSFTRVFNKSEYLSDRISEFRHLGGTSLNESHLSNPEAILNWTNSLDDQGTLVDFGSSVERALLPIWELCDDPYRSATLRAEFERINSSQLSQWPSQRYVTDITLVSSHDEKSARSMCPSGYEIIGTNLSRNSDEYTYMCYRLGDNPRDAYTDLFVEITDRPQNRMDRPMIHNTTYANYIRVPSSLSSSQESNHIYIWGTKNDSLPPITNLSVSSDSQTAVNPNWTNVYWHNTQEAAAVNSGTGGSDLFIKFERS